MYRRWLLQLVTRRVVGCGVLVLCGCLLVVPDSSCEVLLWADRTSLESVDGADVRIVADLGSEVLLQVDDARLAEVPHLRVADPDAWAEASFLLAYGGSIDPLPATIQRLSRGPGNWWFARGERGAIEQLAIRGVTLVELSDTRPRQVLERPASPEPPGVAQAAVQSVVNAVDQLELTATLDALQAFRTRYSYSDSCAAATTYLAERFESMGLEVELDPFVLGDAITVSNVIATHVGSERPDEIIVVCGHFDSISPDPWNDAPGADDNGSGAAAVVEIARVLSQSMFESTLRFICFTGEEQGLVGSKHYVEEIVVPSAMNLRAVINLDMVAFVHPEHPSWDANVYADLASSQSLGAHFSRCIADYTACDEVLIETTDPQYGSDHFWFAQYGYPAVFGIDAQLWGAEDWNPHYHSPEDRVETLDLAYLTQFARGAAGALAELAELVPVTEVADGAVFDGSPRLVVGPSPARGPVTFRWPRGTAAVTVVDVLGRSVADYFGPTPWVWNGRGQASSSPHGVFFYQIETGSEVRTGRIVLIR